MKAITSSLLLPFALLAASAGLVAAAPTPSKPVSSNARRAMTQPPPGRCVFSCFSLARRVSRLPSGTKPPIRADTRLTLKSSAPLLARLSSRPKHLPCLVHKPLSQSRRQPRAVTLSPASSRWWCARRSSRPRISAPPELNSPVPLPLQSYNAQSDEPVMGLAYYPASSDEDAMELQLSDLADQINLVPSEATMSGGSSALADLDLFEIHIPLMDVETESLADYCVSFDPQGALGLADCNVTHNTQRSLSSL